MGLRGQRWLAVRGEKAVIVKAEELRDERCDFCEDGAEMVDGEWELATEKSDVELEGEVVGCFSPGVLGGLLVEGTWGTMVGSGKESSGDEIVKLEIENV
jgi:hypothetical protein